jgi:hypothetical protein
VANHNHGDASSQNVQMQGHGIGRLRRALETQGYETRKIILATLPGAAFGQGSISSMVLPQIDVSATSPVGGAGVDPDKVSGSTQTLFADDFSRTYSPSITDTLMQRVPGVSTTDVQGNGFVQDLRYRGFAASPLQGTPQGLAVYMNGIRVNEAFGDTVNWDLIPTNAINRTDIWTNNPVFGLNALGGAVNIQMKNGFTYSGTEVETQGGSRTAAPEAAQFGTERTVSASIFRRRASRMPAGATSRRRRSDVSTATSAGVAKPAKSRDRRRWKLFRCGRADADPTAQPGQQGDPLASDDTERHDSLLR